MTRAHRVAWVALTVGASVALAGCGGSRKAHRGYGLTAAQPPKKAEPPPDWLTAGNVQKNHICSWGMAGRAYSKASDLPKNLAKERAVKNLAGVFKTNVLEAQIVRAQTSGDVVEGFERAVEVPEEMVEATLAAVSDDDIEYWLDEGGGGPLGREGRDFTYTRVCVDVGMAGLDPDRVKLSQSPPFSREVPEWIDWVGSGKGASLCAVGFSKPFFDAAEIFQGVVEDVRAQLITQAKTMILSSFEEETTCRGGAAGCRQFIEDVVAATTEGISEGVVVTHFWYDARGAGPRKARRTAYGWGCVYPVNELRKAVAKVAKEKPVVDVESVKKASEAMFDELEKMEEQHRDAGISLRTE